MKVTYEIVKTIIEKCPKCNGKGSFGSFTDEYGSLQTEYCSNHCFLGMIITKGSSSVLEYCKQNLSKDDLKCLIKDLKKNVLS